MSNTDVLNKLDEILKQLRRVEYTEASLLFIPPSPAKFWLDPSHYGGTYLERPLSIEDGETKKVVVLEGRAGELFDTILAVQMPDVTDPNVCFLCEFDDSPKIYDWSLYEYKMLGFDSPVADYGGITRYDTTNFYYSCITLWNWRVNDKLKLSIYNYSGVAVEVDVWVAEVYTLLPIGVEFK